MVFAVGLLGLALCKPVEEPLFLGHAPLPGSPVANLTWMDRWFYSFQGDWDQVTREARKQFSALGYKEDAGRIERLRHNVKEGPSGKRWGEYWLGNSIKLSRGGQIVVSVTLLEDSVELVRDCRLEVAKDWIKMGPDKPKDKGWITVIVSGRRRTTVGDSAVRWRAGQAAACPRP